MKCASHSWCRKEEKAADSLRVESLELRLHTCLYRCARQVLSFSHPSSLFLWSMWLQSRNSNEHRSFKSFWLIFLVAVSCCYCTRRSCESGMDPKQVRSDLRSWFCTPEPSLSHPTNSPSSDPDLHSALHSSYQNCYLAIFPRSAPSHRFGIDLVWPVLTFLSLCRASLNQSRRTSFAFWGCL